MLRTDADAARRLCGVLTDATFAATLALYAEDVRRFRWREDARRIARQCGFSERAGDAI